MSYKKCLFFSAAFILRLVIVFLGEMVDRYSDGVKYTDIDYVVFSDASTHVYNGESPYRRHTYRYTPLAAYLTLVNNYIHPVSGKIVFCIFDMLTGITLWKIIESLNTKQNKAYTSYYVAFWLFNPLIVNLSTRGSNDNMISLLVFISIYFILRK